MTFGPVLSPVSSSARLSARLRLFPLAAALVVFATAVPIELRPPRAPDFSLGVLDFVGNLLLYLPLGVALARRPARRAAAIGLLTATAIEVLQIWFVGRYPGMFDVLANASGQVIGHRLGRAFLVDSPRERAFLPVSRETSFAAAIGVVALAILWTAAKPGSDFSNWSPDFRLLTGNEVTGDRPWRGRIDVLGIGSEPLTIREVQRFSALTDPELRTALKGLHAAYLADFPLDFETRGAHEMSPGVAHALYIQARTRNALTVVARVATGSTAQTGPSRLVSFSKNTVARNFDLGQEGPRLWFRVRTPLSGDNGMDGDLYVETSPVFVDERPITIVATYDGGVARVFSNGGLVGRRNIAAAACAIPTTCDSDLPLASAAFGALASLIPLGSWRPRTLLTARSVMLACGIAAALFIGGTAVRSTNLALLAQICTLTGAVVTVLAVVPGPE